MLGPAPAPGQVVMGQRLGGLCVGACDSDWAMRSVFFATYGKQSLANLKLMGTDPRTLRAADVVCCGFCCKPFTPCGLQKGWEDESYGDNYDLMVDGTPRSVGSNHGTSQAAPDLLLTPSAPRIGAALEARRQAGVLDRCLLVENVPNLLRFLSQERLARLSATGWHYKIYVVAAPFFGCANLRERLVLIAFRDPAHLAAFVPPPATSATPPPVSSILLPCPKDSSRELFIKPQQYKKTDAPRVVGKLYPLGIGSPVSRCTAAVRTSDSQMSAYSLLLTRLGSVSGQLRPPGGARHAGLLRRPAREPRP